MKELNNKGFTLIETLAVVVILSVLIAIMVPSVNHLIEKNKENNYQSLKDGIVSAAKIYVSDNRYDITLDYADNGGLCSEGEDEEDIVSIAGNDLSLLLGVSKLPIRFLVDSEDLTTDSNGNITNPRNKEEILDLDASYVLVKYQCASKDYIYSIEDAFRDDYLEWEKNT